ncbi:WD40 repeat domain-containing serine/threonine protein kinase [Nocardiopsis sp. NRRL B-16309]|uniref:WD40 repeat domain-containing serine/threonine protein kinase n=1 Tax=Nocardiopsis sp. NRRL B-16309 TaxID=1519494 RepID=UPI0006AFBEE8|nr:serine/threonine-protein kinase [Nocardiopsis sp. NRRL B-16309]KOX15613.1 phosphotransferase [Nocardiopsis sp. NRRL B-16309]
MHPLHPSDPTRIGPYRLTHRLGAGGMGRVYLARTPSGRALVIKVVLPELAREDGFRARFAREADAARRVGGFHTAQVVDSAPDADLPWIATAHIPGPTLGQAVREHGPMTPPALHGLATGLAEGLEAIHACGLVHRDLKPANIILADDGPRIIDFGIARPLDADSMTTQGAVFGTLPYMSPEQTDGSRVGPASDVFSLGTVLAYAATGTNPFSGATMAETLRRLISPPPDPGEFDPDIRTLIGQCWDHDPDRRPTPSQILNRFEELGPGSRPSRRILGPGPDTAPPVAPDPSVAEEAPVLPTGDPRFGTGTGAGGALTSTSGRTRPSATDTAVSTAPATVTAGSGAGRPRKNMWRYISAAIAVAVLVALVVGEYLPTADVTFAGHEGSVDAVAFGADGDTLATAGSDGTVRLWDAGTGDQVATLTGDSDDVHSVAFSPDGTTLASGGGDTVRLWDAGTGDQVAALTGHEGSVYAVAFSPDGRFVASADGDTVRLSDVGTGEQVAALTGHSYSVRSVAFSPDGTTLATGSNDGTVRLWEAGTGEPVATLTAHQVTVAAVAFSPDGTTLASGGFDNTVRLWDVGTGEQITTLAEYRESVLSVAFGPDGTTLATGGNDGVVRLVDVDTGHQIATLTDHDDSVTSVAFSPDGNSLVAGNDDGTPRLWTIG